MTSMAALALAGPARAQAPAQRKLLATFFQSPGVSGPVAVSQAGWFQNNPMGKHLAQHGWSEQNLRVERWHVESLHEKDVETIAKQVVQNHPDVIVAETADLAQALRAQTKTIAIVAAVDDPLVFGIGKGGLRTGTNVTGWEWGPVTALERQLPLLKELVPTLTTVHIVVQQSVRRRLLERKLAESGLAARTWPDYEGFEKGMEHSRPGPRAALWIDDVEQDDAHLAQLARRLRMPSTGANEDIAQVGGLFYCNLGFRQRGWPSLAAPFVEKVLRGEDPGAIPLQRPAVTQFVVNLETARAIDIAIPKTWLTRATHVIEASKAESVAAGKGPKRIIWSRVAYPAMDRIREAFRSRGFVEGRDIALSFREFPPDDGTRVDELADSLVLSKPDIIVLHAHGVLWALKKRTRDIPVVFYNLAFGSATDTLVASRARPGGNFTGHTISAGGASLMAKQFNVFKDLVPSLKRLALVEDKHFFDETSRRTPTLRDEYLKTLRALEVQLGIEIVLLKVSGDADEAARAVAKSGAQFVSLSAYAAPEVERRLLSTPIPVSCFTFGKVQRGCLCGWDIDWTEGETYVIQVVERILRGESPAVIPVSEGTRMPLALNRRRARELGIKIPSSLLVEAAEIYE